MKLGVQKHSNRCRVSGGDNFLRRNDIDIPTAGDFFSRRLTAAMFAGEMIVGLTMIQKIQNEKTLLKLGHYKTHLNKTITTI